MGIAFYISIILTIIPFPDPVLVQAEGFLNVGQFEEAATEFKRYIFFHANSANDPIGDVYYQLGIALRNCGHYEDSLDAFDLSLQWEDGRWTYDDKRISKAVCLTALGRYSEAEFAFLRIEVSATSEIIRRKPILFRAINALYGHNWDQAREALQSYIDNAAGEKDMGLSRVIQNLLNNMNGIRLKSAKKAKVFSTILPGSGQIYARDWKGGLNSLFLNGIFGFLLVEDIISQNYVQAALCSFFLFKRFYAGNRRNAARSAEKYNDSMYRHIALEFFNELNK